MKILIVSDLHKSLGRLSKMESIDLATGSLRRAKARLPDFDSLFPK